MMDVLIVEKVLWWTSRVMCWRQCRRTRWVGENLRSSQMHRDCRWRWWTERIRNRFMRCLQHDVKDVRWRWMWWVTMCWQRCNARVACVANWLAMHWWTTVIFIIVILWWHHLWLSWNWIVSRWRREWTRWRCSTAMDRCWQTACSSSVRSHR